MAIADWQPIDNEGYIYYVDGPHKAFQDQSGWLMVSDYRPREYRPQDGIVVYYPLLSPDKTCHIAEGRIIEYANNIGTEWHFCHHAALVIKNNFDAWYADQQKGIRERSPFLPYYHAKVIVAEQFLFACRAIEHRRLNQGR